MINSAMLRLYEVTDLSTFVYVATADKFDARQIAEDRIVKRLDHVAIVAESDGQDVEVRGKTLNQRFQEQLKPGVVHIVRT